MAKRTVKTLDDLIKIQDDVYKKAGHGHRLKRYGKPRPSQAKLGGDVRLTILLDGAAGGRFAAAAKAGIKQRAADIAESIPDLTRTGGRELNDQERYQQQVRRIQQAVGLGKQRAEKRRRGKR